jgi:hypothetical protein
MAAFDPDTWRDRAWRRYEASLRAGKLASKAQQQVDQDVAATESLRVVVEWCKARSLTVVFTKRAGGLYHPSDREIRVNGRASPLRQLHLMLHECGHFLIGSKDKHERFGMGYNNTDPEVKRSLIHRIDCVDEEFEAWHRGWKLGKRLRVLSNADKVEFDKTRAEMLKTYMLWGAKANGYGAYADPTGDEFKEETSPEEKPSA